MDFTREPVIETVITPKEGCKLVIRNSKGVGQEEYFVDAVEVITFGSSIFFRSLERPKPFLLPVSDYEVLEVREARMVLKNVGLEKNIKISGGRESSMKPPKEPQGEREIQTVASDAQDVRPQTGDMAKGEGRGDRRRDRRRGSRRRRDRIEGQETSTAEQSADESAPDREDSAAPLLEKPNVQGSVSEVREPTLLSSLLAPPPLISETISRYKEKFKEAFYSKEEQEKLEAEEGLSSKEPEIPLSQPAFGSFEISEEAEEEIYRERRRHFFDEKEVKSEEAAPLVKTEEPQNIATDQKQDVSSEEGST